MLPLLIVKSFPAPVFTASVRFRAVVFVSSKSPLLTVTAPKFATTLLLVSNTLPFAPVTVKVSAVTTSAPF